MIVFDVNKEAVNKFLQEHAGTNVTAASSPKEIAEVAVSTQMRNIVH
jgi:3-hydroxyisobutyrate dehydrogenase